MRFLIIILSLYFLISISADGQYEERPKYAPRKEKHRNKTDELNQMQGVWKYYNSYHEITREIEYQNNIRNGVSRFYYSYGKVKEEIEYQFGVKEGVYKRYYYNGQVNIEGQYAAGKKSDVWNTYYSDGVLKNEGSFKRGNREGEWRFYNHKGDLINSITYKGGVDLKAIAEAEKKTADAKKAAEEKAKKKPTLIPRKVSGTISPVTPPVVKDSIKK